MFDQSFSPPALASMLRKGDFKLIASASCDTFRDIAIENAIKSADTIFGKSNPILKFHLKKKSAYRITNLPDELVVRKLTKNLKNLSQRNLNSRASMVANLIHFLEEGVPYRVYRLDVRQYYESFDIPSIQTHFENLTRISPRSKNLLFNLLQHYQSLGGSGVPRGMAISAVLTEYMMRDFDQLIYSRSGVYFYSRYVDDIIIVTNLENPSSNLIDYISKILPKNLTLNTTKTKISEIIKEAARSEKSRPLVKVPLADFEFLGYSFNIYEAGQSERDVPYGVRKICVEIASKKVLRIKTRIVKALIDYIKTRDFTLLNDRIKLLTSNFAVYNKNTGAKNLAGIYYGYPALSKDSQTLLELDRFLKGSILSKNGRMAYLLRSSLTNREIRILLSHNFSNGYKNRSFVYFSPTKIGEIQRCWKYE